MLVGGHLTFGAGGLPFLVLARDSLSSCCVHANNPNYKSPEAYKRGYENVVSLFGSVLMKKICILQWVKLQNECAGNAKPLKEQGWLSPLRTLKPIKY